jgi:hypothetical protein
LESEGNLIGSGGSLYCDSRERGEFSFIDSGVVEQAVWGVGTRSQGIEVAVGPSPHSRSAENNASETCSRSSPYSYVLATLAHYEGCSIFILLRLWFNDVVSHVGMSL